MEKNPKCSPYDLRALEAWLTKQAGKGLELTDEWKEFREGEKREKQFYIEPAEENDEPSQPLLDSRALMGWEYVCSMEKNAFYVWRSVGSSAKAPRARELAGSWADRRLGQKMRWWWLAQMGSLALLAAGAFYLLYDNDMPTWRLLTNGSGQMSILTLLLGMLCGFWATRRELRDLRRLRRAVRAGEYEKPVAQHTAWYEAMRWLPVALAVLLLIPFIRLDSGELDAQEQSFLAAEDLGGEAGERFADDRTTPLCDVVVVREGNLAGWDDRSNWYDFNTQLEVYRPRPGIMAKPLARELVRHYSMAQVDILDGVDAAYYGAADGVQRLLLRDGGMVLFYRTNAPDDLRQRADTFAALVAAYR